jgi:hypothetical protein
LGTPTATQLTEGFLLGETSIADGELIALGRLYDTSGGSEDLILQYNDIQEGLTVGSVSYETPVEGDIDLDGDVDFEDAWALLGHYRTGDSDLLWTQGDFTGDGFVDGDDASLLIDNWALGAGGGLFHRRRRWLKSFQSRPRWLCWPSAGCARCCVTAADAAHSTRLSLRRLCSRIASTAALV